MIFHPNCRCDYGQMALSAEIEKVLVEICMLSSRRLDDTKARFVSYLGKQPYSALDLAQICRHQAGAGLPLPWEDNYEQSVLERIFV